MESKINVSVILPTYNGIEYIDEVLTAVFSQKTQYKYEVIVVDSGSVDGTIEIVKKYPVRYYAIDKKEFGHGKTRNYAASLANGEFLVFITQDATPANDSWLDELIAGFHLDSAVACVFGKHIPRADCNPTTQKDIIYHFKNFSVTNEPLIQYVADNEEGWEHYRNNQGWMAFNSNVNSALRKDVWEQIKFRDVIYSEDQLMGKDIMENKYKKVYSPTASVIHSHSYPLNQYIKRFFDEYRGLELTLGYIDQVTLLRLIPASLKATYNDAKYIIKECQYTKRQQFYWIYFTFWLNVYRRLGAYFGGRHKKMPRFLKRMFSLEKNAG
ncbi:glycosyltransferase family 2 protein [Paenibacillus sp. sptzw28]|uniref:glycosyltransferase family 2 protein n=1 Tax=Paenibacillus sp. sptzw28 TaxID=715179 RepID=UPI001C6E8511|nr:glycosyltransferase family 2 protein [Paenibacillus sp. sptzw28]QYR21217.1 glycosyltransferase family 2 protein [Paenibacillus sp. sptzw28]